MYTLVGQKCGTVLLDPRTTGVVNSEAVRPRHAPQLC